MYATKSEGNTTTLELSGLAITRSKARPPSSDEIPDEVCGVSCASMASDSGAFSGSVLVAELALSRRENVTYLTDREIADLDHSIAIPIQDGNVERSYRAVDRCTRLAAYI